MKIKVTYSDNFGGSGTSFVDLLNKKMDEIQTAVEDTVVETFTRVVQRTPIKTGDLISAWEVTVAGKSTTKPIDYFNSNENTTPAWSRQKAYDLSRGFKEIVSVQVRGTMPTTKYIISNEIEYAADIEYGLYPGMIYEEAGPPYYDRPYYTPPFVLTTGGRSHKAMLGMVRVSAIEAGAVLKQKLNGEV